VAGTVLLCSEGGIGRGQGRRLLEIGTRLAQDGWQPVYALRSGGGSAVLVHNAGQPLVDAPVWEPTAEPLRSSVTLADMLWDEGLSSEDAIADQISAWHMVFSQVAPRLIVTDMAPGAVLAARGRFPVFVTGNGFFAPPSGLDRFPALHDIAHPRIDQNALMATVNAALARFGAAPLAALPALFAGDDRCAITFAELDPYYDHRSQPALPPEVRIAAAPGRRDTLFVYFWAGARAGDARTMVDALCGLDMPRRIFAPRLVASDMNRLAASGCVLEAAPVDTGDIAATSRLCLHRGGLGLANAMLVAGVGQVIAATDIEKQLNGAAVARIGAGKMVPLWASSAESLAATIADAWDDAALAETARVLSGDFAQRADNGTFQEIADRAVRLVR